MAAGLPGLSQGWTNQHSGLEGKGAQAGTPLTAELFATNRFREGKLPSFVIPTDDPMDTPNCHRWPWLN